jgi:DMSO/TMAO reductase YedYZ molybdopterin-dependent catalytic subunit
LVVPGFYGTNSVKWLWRIKLAAERADGPFTSTYYNDRAAADDLAAGGPPERSVWAIAPESVIVTPAPDAAVALGELVEIWGWAWSFRGVVAVEVSVDDGASFAPATLEPRRQWSWQCFALRLSPAARAAKPASRRVPSMRTVSRRPARARAMRSTRCPWSCAETVARSASRRRTRAAARPPGFGQRGTSLR